MKKGILLGSFGYEHGAYITAPASQRPETNQSVSAVVPCPHNGRDGAGRVQVLNEECGLASRVLHQSRLWNTDFRNGESVEISGLIRRGCLHGGDPEWPKEAASGHGYLKLCPIDLPKVISPLSMRMLKPQSGLEQTQAL